MKEQNRAAIQTKLLIKIYSSLIRIRYNQKQILIKLNRQKKEMIYFSNIMREIRMVLKEINKTLIILAGREKE